MSKISVRNIWLIATLCAALLVCVVQADAAKFKDVLQQALIQAATGDASAGGGGGNIGGGGHYTFAPGDRIIDKTDYAVYYAGSNYTAGGRALLLTMVESGVAIQLVFPSPDVIQVRDVRLRVVDFNNERLTVELLGQLAG